MQMSKPKKKKAPPLSKDQMTPGGDAPDLRGIVSTTECTGAMPALPPEEMPEQQGDGG